MRKAGRKANEKLEKRKRAYAPVSKQAGYREPGSRNGRK
jgi:hypothetical protein